MYHTLKTFLREQVLLLQNKNKWKYIRENRRVNRIFIHKGQKLEIIQIPIIGGMHLKKKKAKVYSYNRKLSSIIKMN